MIAEAVVWSNGLRSDGIQISRAEARRMIDHREFFWDDKKDALIWRGELNEGDAQKLVSSMEAAHFNTVCSEISPELLLEQLAQEIDRRFADGKLVTVSLRRQEWFGIKQALKNAALIDTPQEVEAQLVRDLAQYGCNFWLVENGVKRRIPPANVRTSKAPQK